MSISAPSITAFAQHILLLELQMTAPRDVVVMAPERELTLMCMLRPGIYDMHKSPNAETAAPIVSYFSLCMYNFINK